jgi:hypothetical protein
MPTPPGNPSVYQLKITLLGIEPPIWRRVQVPSTLLLCCVHDAFQTVMRWTDSHLHMFEKDGKNWGWPDDDELEADVEIIDESRVGIGKVLTVEGDTLVYVYDFGDNWRHEVLLEKIVPVAAMPKPVCLDGKRRCPPEDVGGPHGYQEFLDVIFEPGHDEFEHYRVRAGNAVHAEDFDVKAVNETLDRMRWPKRHRR